MLIDISLVEMIYVDNTQDNYCSTDSISNIQQNFWNIIIKVIKAN